MPEYAYRAIDGGGSPVRVAVSAEDPEQVVLQAREAGHHVVMLYRLKAEPEPHYERVLEALNSPPPPFLKGGSFVLWRSRKALRAAVRNGLVEGRLGWLRTKVRTESLLKVGMAELGRRVFREGLLAFAAREGKPATRPRGGSGLALAPYEVTEFSRAPLVEAEEDFEPPENLRGLITGEVAHANGVVPHSLKRNEIRLLSQRPWDLSVLDALRALLGTNVRLVRCAAEPCENWNVVLCILGRVYPPSQSIEALLEQSRVELGEESEPWEGSERGLPPLPVEREQPLPDSRTEVFLSEASAVALEPESDPCPIAKLVELLVSMAGRDGWTGVRLRPGERASVVEFLHGEEVCEFAPPPRRLHENVVLFLAGAVGVEPAVLPPARSKAELELEGRAFAVTGETHFSDLGEGIEVRWSAELSS